MEKDTSAATVAPRVMTVLGPLAPGEDLGSVLMNEHLVCETSKKRRRHDDTTKNEGDNLKMSLENLHAIRSRPLDCADNMTLYSQHEVLTELQHLQKSLQESSSSLETKQQQQQQQLTILDVTNSADGRDLKSAQIIARRLGIHVIVGTSCCAETGDRDGNDIGDREAVVETTKMERDIAHLEEELMFGRNINSKANGKESESTTTKEDDKDIIRAGFIGQVLISESFPPIEREELKACAVVQGSTKAPLIVAAPASCLVQVLNQIEASGGSLHQTVLVHMDLCYSNMELLQRVLNRGAVVCFDQFSVASACFDFDRTFPTVTDTVECLVALLQVNMAFVHQIVLSSGLVMRLQYRKYGGVGYPMLFEELLPRLERKGVSKEQIRIMMNETPRRLLEWWTPPPEPVKPIEYLTCSVCLRLFEPVLGEYFHKYAFTYCGRECLKKHVKNKFKPL